MKFSQLADLARSMDARAFAARHPDAALLPVDGFEGEVSQAFDTPDRGSSIEPFVRRRASDTYVALEPRVTETPTRPFVLADCEVIALTKTDRNPFAQMVTVGRSPNNDVILNERSVSKVHAYFARRDGRTHLHDQPSTNGTFLDGVRVPTAGVPVRDGQRVRFGLRSSFVFYEPAGLHALLRGT